MDEDLVDKIGRDIKNDKSSFIYITGVSNSGIEISIKVQRLVVIFFRT